MEATVSKGTETAGLRQFAWLSTALLAAAGCFGGSDGLDPELQAQRRELSKQTVTTEELPSREADDEALAMRMGMGMAGAGAEYAPDDTDAEDEEEAPADEDDGEAPAPADDDAPQTEPAPPPEDTFANDSVRCGDGVVDGGELCDISIEEGVPGACPMDCDNTDPCKPLRYVVAGCRTRCMPMEPEPGACD